MNLYQFCCRRLSAALFLLPQNYETVKSFTISDMHVFLFLNKNMKDFSLFFTSIRFIFICSAPYCSIRNNNESANAQLIRELQTGQSILSLALFRPAYDAEYQMKQDSGHRN